MQIVLARNQDGIFVSGSEEIQEILTGSYKALVVDEHGKYHYSTDLDDENLFVGSVKIEI